MSTHIYRVAYFKSKTHNKRNDVIKMQMIQFENAFDVIEMFESRFSFANVEMSLIVRDSIETTLSQIDELNFNVDALHSFIESSLHTQIAFNYAKTMFNENDDENDFVVNAIARNIHENITMFEIVHVQSMHTMHQFIVTHDLRICAL